MSTSNKISGKTAKRKTNKQSFDVASIPIAKTSSGINQLGIDEKTLSLCDELMSSEWQMSNVRPKPDMYGWYVICRWYPKDNAWAVLYVGHGYVKAKLDGHFSGGSQHKSVIGSYLSSFPKQCRNLLWFKWCKDPFYPNEVITTENLITAVAELYNNGERPAFNLTANELESGNDGPLPDNFSIIPDYQKVKRQN